jgi:hypothetical protein
MTASNSAGTGPASDPSQPVTPVASVVSVQDRSPAVSYGSWVGVVDSAASGGSYRTSQKATATATFAFTGTSVRWATRKGPDRGFATVIVDGVSKGTVDLYAATPVNATLSYGGLTSGNHALILRVLGSKRAAATGANVPVDGFLVGTSTTRIQDSSVRIGYDTWTGTSNASASGSTYRRSLTAGATTALSFTGTGIDWVTAVGPGYGKASVSVDGGTAVVVDLYRATQNWQTTGRSISGLPAGPHRIEITVLGTKNAASTGNTVVLDTFIVHP